MSVAISEIARYIANHVAIAEPLFHQTELAWWDAETTGTDEAHERLARLNAETMRLYADEGAYRTLRRWIEGTPPDDALLARQLRVLYLAYAQGQRDPATIDRVAELERDVQQIYTTYRGRYQGADVSDNELEKVLNTEVDSARVREAWEASKEVGGLVADKVLDLVRRRNDAARRLGFSDHYEKSLFLSEIEPDRLFTILGDLDRLTTEPWRHEMERLNHTLASRFGLGQEELRPWHYGNPFFQRPPQAATVDLDHLFADRSLEELTVRTFDGLGMDVRDILARSDLYERPGKSQHAFCTHIGRTGDVRVLCNLEPNLRWTETLLHELGHGVYDKYIDRELPFLLRTPAHTLTTEAIAMLMGRLPLNPEWLRQVAGVSADEVAGITEPIRQQLRLAQLLFVRWVLVMVHFERAMYRDPEQDLNRLWWDLVERYQMVRRPEGRDRPDWAAKLHLALAPVYYQNYMLGELLASHVTSHLRETAGGLVDRPEAGAYLRDRIFTPGDTADWDRLVEVATGERLNPAHFVREFVG